MCKVLEREGREWALDTLRKMQGLATGPDGARRIIEQMERGKRAKPASYAKGVQQVIDKVRHVARTQTVQQA